LDPYEDFNEINTYRYIYSMKLIKDDHNFGDIKKAFM